MVLRGGVRSSRAMSHCCCTSVDIDGCLHTYRILHFSLRLVNTYGNFGSITKARGEVVLKGTMHHDPFAAAATWKEYGEFCGVNILYPLSYRKRVKNTRNFWIFYKTAKKMDKIITEVHTQPSGLFPAQICIRLCFVCVSRLFVCLCVFVSCLFG